MRTVIIGSGNVATVLGKKIFLAGHQIIQIFSRNVYEGGELAQATGAKFCGNQSCIDLTADLYIISVSDKALPEIAGWLRVPGKIVVHTAGSVSISVLKDCSDQYGIVYPLQTIRKETAIIPEVPLLIDGNNEVTQSVIFDFAATISATVEFADDDKRSKLHVAAVIMNNFSNHLYTLAADFCRNENLDFRLLIPLISETAERLKTSTPDKVQTGPAVRRDMQTIARHEEKLKNYPGLLELYSLFTKKIIAYYHFFFFFFLLSFISVSCRYLSIMMFI